MGGAIFDGGKDRTKVPRIFAAIILVALNLFVHLTADKVFLTPAKSLQSYFVGSENKPLPANGDYRPINPA